MRKDLEWLKKEIAKEMSKLEHNRNKKDGDLKYQTLRSVAEKIYQLDEPEVLSQKWIDKNVIHIRGFGDIFKAEDVEGILVPKQEITEEQVMDWLDRNDFYDHITAETVLERAVDKGELSYYGTNYSVIEAPIDEPEVTLDRAFEEISQSYPVTKEEIWRHLEQIVAHGGKVTYGEQEALSQDLPVVPAWFDEWWEDVSQGEGNLFHNINQFHDKLYSSGTREMYNYINAPDNKKKLLNIIINELDYKVEDEQKYFVSSRESVGFWFLSKNNDNEVVIGTNKDYYDRKWESLKLTEEEIKDYDSRYWAFAVKVEEVEE